MKIIKYIAVLFIFAPLSAFADEAPTESAQNSQCGIISIYKKPPEAKNIYRVNINSIDGVFVGSRSHSFQLSPGKHKIKVIEQITDSYFTRRRGEMLNYKTFEVDVKADGKYYLGAKYIRKNRSKLKSGEYWEPIIWKTSNSSCEL